MCCAVKFVKRVSQIPDQFFNAIHFPNPRFIAKIDYVGVPPVFLYGTARHDDQIPGSYAERHGIGHIWRFSVF